MTYKLVMRNLCAIADDDFSHHIQRAQLTALYRIKGATEPYINFRVPAAVPELVSVPSCGLQVMPTAHEPLEKAQEQFSLMSVPSPGLKVALTASKVYTLHEVSSTTDRANCMLAHPE